MPLRVLLLWMILYTPMAHPYDLLGIDATFNFGTIAPPFPDLTLTDNSICVGYTVLVEPANYYVRATSTNGGTNGFRMVNSLNNAYTLDYSVAWAGTAGSSPTFVPLASGQRSSTTFPAQLLGGLTCLLLPNNATMRLQLLSGNQMLAKQGTYSDTLTVLITSS